MSVPGLAAPAGRRVLGEISLAIRSHEKVEIELALAGEPTSDPGRDEKAAVLTVCFLDKSGAPIDQPIRYFTRSDVYGWFRYLELHEAVATWKDVVAAPAEAGRVIARVFPFSNADVSATGFGLGRARATPPPSGVRKR